jgi:hypothetical protein
MNKEPIFYNSNGTLTKYALFCGYVEKKTTKAGGVKKMYIEHNHIHIRYTNSLNTLTPGYLAGWEVFNSDELTKARKFFNNIKI